MNQVEPPRRDANAGDGWTVIAYLLSGLLLWGGIGVLLDRWLGTSFFALVGMLVGGVGAIYLVYIRYGKN
jgi:F0F1-type ATP synthase assembly protein I